jgi:hypothetical protein
MDSHLPNTPIQNTFLFCVIAFLLGMPLRGFADELSDSFDAIEGKYCITCALKKNNPPKSKNTRDLESVQEVIKPKAKPQADSCKPGCIDCCDVKKVTASGKVILATATEETWKDFPEVLNYGNSTKVQNMIDDAMINSSYFLGSQGVRTSRKRSPNYSTGWCFRHVKKAILSGGLSDTYMDGIRVNIPKDKAIKSLENAGFKNILNDKKYNGLITNVASAPKGAVLIYEGGGNGGHIEIKTEWGTKGTYVSDYRSPNSVLQNETTGLKSKNFRLIGVMIQPKG